MSPTNPLSTVEEPPDGSISLGGQHWYTKIHHPYTGEWVGINEWHRHPVTQNLCGGWAPFISYDPEDGWLVESLDPLTLAPSLLCTMPNCGNHGFIRNGLWEGC